MSAVAGIASVPGVTACVLFDEAGQRVDVRTLDPLGASEALDHTIRRLTAAMQAMAKSHPPTGLFARTELGWMLARRIGGFSLLVIGRGAPRTAMLDVALAVLASRLQPVRGHGRRVSLPTAQMTSDRGAPVGLTLLKELLALLVRHVGDASARATLKRELASLGESPHTVTRELFPYLIERLALRIPDPAAQTAFRREARDILPPATG